MKRLTLTITLDVPNNVKAKDVVEMVNDSMDELLEELAGETDEVDDLGVAVHLKKIRIS